MRTANLIRSAALVLAVTAVGSPIVASANESGDHFRETYARPVTTQTAFAPKAAVAATDAQIGRAAPRRDVGSAQVLSDRFGHRIVIETGTVAPGSSSEGY